VTHNFTIFLNTRIPYYNWCLAFSSVHSSAVGKKTVERIKSVVFLCMYCNNPNPITLSVINFEYHISGAYATAFFICPDCDNKFVVKIQDIGKVR
jgi:hypothetical protein